jgi:thiol-disulfide isomerase/thioredoxin
MAGVVLLVMSTLIAGASPDPETPGAFSGRQRPAARGAAQTVGVALHDFSGTLPQRAFDQFAAVDVEGRRWDAAAFAGRVVLIQFWASWCSPCMAEIPHLRQMRERLGEDRFEVLGVNLDRSQPATVLPLIRRLGVTWPQIHDGRGYNGEVARLFGVRYLPTSFLVDRNGRIVAVNLRRAMLDAALEVLMGESEAPAAASNEGEQVNRGTYGGHVSAGR